MPKGEFTMLELEGHEVRFSNPGKVFFPAHGYTKLDLCEYYLDVADAVLRGLRDRPTTLKRFRDGVEGDFFFQKRVPPSQPDWLQQWTLHFPSGRNANFLVCQDKAHLAWGVNLGVIDWNPWPVRRPEGDHPDELRIDLDPTPEASWDDVRQVALLVRDVLSENGLVGYPKTSGSRGIHIYARIEQQWDFTEVRRAALALGREVERRAPKIATTAWWKEERHGVFLDYNQNARDRTIASQYSVRPNADALVSAPITWAEVPDVDPHDLRMDSVPGRLREIGDPYVDMDATPGSLAGLHELARRDEEGGLGDAPWPPNFPKQKGEPKRVQPSRAKKE